jgi:hypothetical protein
MPPSGDHASVVIPKFAAVDPGAADALADLALVVV